MNQKTTIRSMWKNAKAENDSIPVIITGWVAIGSTLFTTIFAGVKLFKLIRK